MVRVREKTIPTGPAPVAVGFDNYSPDLMPFVLPDADARPATEGGRASVGELGNK